MHWLIQDNIGVHREQEYSHVIDLFSKMDIPHTVVNITPKTYELDPLIDLEGKNVTVIGTVLFTKIAIERGWTVWRNENFDSRKWIEYYGEEMLNYDAKVCKFSEVPEGHPDTLFFLRPVYDHKVFTGCVVSREEWRAWSEGTADIQKRHKDLGPDTLVSYATNKKIYREYRFYVVDGKVITGSLYRRGKDMFWETCTEEDTIAYCQKMVDVWQPDRVFVMDIAYLGDNEFKIIEINCANSAGMYKCNMQKFIEAVEEMQWN